MITRQDIDDDFIDARLRAAPVRVGGDFTAATLARVLSETPDSAADAQLDALLEAMPLEPNGAFVTATAARCREAGRTHTFLLRFPLWVSSLAAALAVGLFFALPKDAAAPLAAYEVAEFAQWAEPLADAEPFFDEANLDALRLVASLPL